MADAPQMQPAGWYHAQGDPPGTHRYWDGFQWQGGPQPVAAAPAPVASHPFAGARPLTSPPATYGRRVVAVLIDAGLNIGVTLGGFIVAAVLGAVSEPLGTVAFVLAMVASVGFSIWNYIVLQGRTGQSLGKRWQGIKLVADKTNEPVGVGMSFVRYLVATAINTVTCGVGGILDYLWPLWDDDNKRLTDKVLKFSVVVA